jgi:outer membrane protein OmpA-like peptidoglycan-associated protein
MILGLLLVSSTSQAEGVRVHLAGGAAVPIGASSPARDFGAGGGAAATVEVPASDAFSVQGTGGGFALPADSSPADPSVAPKATGTAVYGTAGVRVRPLGASRGSGPWLDVNGGLGQTGSLARPVVEAHVGWEFRTRDGRWSAGPFVGYTQILQPNDSLRPDDARIGWVGLAIGLGSPDRKPSTKAPAPPRPQEKVATKEEPPEPEGFVEAFDQCPEGKHAGETGCVADVRLVGDRIVLGESIHFEFDSPWVRERSFPLLRKIASFIKQHPDIVEVSIEGHADAVGDGAYNQRLSEARADVVRALLVRFGVDGWCLLVSGHGAAQPKVATERAEPLNRRVEFVVKRMRESDTSRESGYSAAREKEKP